MTELLITIAHLAFYVFAAIGFVLTVYHSYAYFRYGINPTFTEHKPIETMPEAWHALIKYELDGVKKSLIIEESEKYYLITTPGYSSKKHWVKKDSKCVVEVGPKPLSWTLRQNDEKIRHELDSEIAEELSSVQ